MFTAYWEIVSDDHMGEDCLDADAKEFDNFTDAIEWLGTKDTDIDYYCVITDETGRVVHTGWMP